MVASTYDCVRLAAFAVAVVVLAFQKTKYFLLADALLNMTMAVLTLLRPNLFQSQLNIQFDSLHIWMQQAMCCFSLFFVVFYFFFVRQSRDEDSSHGLIATRTLLLGLSTIILAVDEWRFPKLFKDTFFPSMLLISLMWTCVSAYHVYRSGINLPKRGRVSPINFYIKIDIVLVLLLGGGDMLMAPYTCDTLSMKIDHLHEHLTSACGALHFTSGILGIYALGFRNVTERKGFLCCRITALLFIAAFLAYSVLVKKMTMTNMDIAVMMTPYIPILPAVFGLLSTSDRRSFSSSSGGYNLRTRSR